MKIRSPLALKALLFVCLSAYFLAPHSNTTVILPFNGVGVTQAQDAAPVVGTSPEAPATGTPSFGEAISKMMPVILVSFFIFYFMVIKPQNQKATAQKTLLSTLTKGDTVVTTSGLIAKVSHIDPGYITLEIAPQVRLRFEAEHIKQKFEEKKVELTK